MIQTPTVLVLGAGTSMAYGYPSGADLVDQISTMIDPAISNNQIPDFQTAGYSLDQIREFRDDLIASDDPSVDAFLERRDIFLDIGKFAIAKALIPYEAADRVYMRVYRQKHWYKELLNCIKANATFDDLHSTRLTIVTFNYDRSLDHYLAVNLCKSYGKSMDQVLPILRSIPIHHVHGKLGDLPWEGNDVREFIPTASLQDIKAASQRIVIIHEKSDTAPIFDIAYQAMEAASAVYILGFGYHPKNIKRLRLAALPKEGRVIVATSNGFTDYQVTRLRSRLPNVVFQRPRYDALSFFQNCASLE